MTNTFIMGSTRYRVVAACVVARSVSGGESYHMRGTLLPVGTDPTQLERLLRDGMIKELEVAA